MTKTTRDSEQMKNQFMKNALFKEAIQFLEANNIEFILRKPTSSWGSELDLQIFIPRPFESEDLWLQFREIMDIDHTDAKGRFLNIYKKGDGFRWTHSIAMLAY